VSWSAAGTNSLDVRARRYDATGAPVGDEFDLSTPGLQASPSLASNAAGSVFAAWTNVDTINTTDASPFGVQGQLVQPVTEIVNGTDGDDTITTYGLGEAINGLNGDDTINGVGGNDVIHGNNGLDRLLGGAGDDMVFGDAGIDVINGEDGNDVLIGGRAKDVMNGGAGADRFDFNGISDSRVGTALRDIIKGFQHSEGDRIDLRDIDADTDRTAGNQKFKFIGTSAFNGIDGELRFAGGIVQGDTNGDGIANFEIKVAGLVNAVAGDFVL
jgi:Ca2+-binding RTX toxin-like protein